MIEPAARNFGIDSSGQTNVKKLQRVRPKRNQIPQAILESIAIRQAIEMLPNNYNFEIPKTIWRIFTLKSKVVALQFPEGLLMYSTIISDIIVKFCNVRVIILGDVTYGACCIDDFTASKLGADLLVHYGHSCLVPISTTVISVMYVFVEISFDCSHLVESVARNFAFDAPLALMGTIQFVSMLHLTRKILQDSPHHFCNLTIPQVHPLSMGETLGCTAPRISAPNVVFVADGRFHLEAAMIMNPDVKAFRYDPYSKILTREAYDIDHLRHQRLNEIVKSRSAKVFGLILGTLGRQGNRLLFDRIMRLLRKNDKIAIPLLMAEINPVKLSLLTVVDVWVQVACPRLSVDWGTEYGRPLLNSYELEVCLEETNWHDVYPMDYYSASGGSWSNAIGAANSN